ncbi:hypothetical protein HPO96_27220 [Kribbella sandramycini]|uniref:Uncharacterized protein n=1 Tax=Kribbella sandramycini TaxID=60450 RepID=A0A7Y4L418_9ACTN|nr:hypothetical protein [Kribbella sandramycini]MBB6570814.1 hypothetical protein [Kribbella sandramycini]NOL43945.1 hypothetical protein [Kribbella sandramycini]
MREKVAGYVVAGCMLFLHFTLTLGLMFMPGQVGADWPGWQSTMFLVGITVVPAAMWLIIMSSGGLATARWISAVAVGGVLLRVLWTAYDGGWSATVAVLPVLLFLLGIAVWLVYTWPRSSRPLRDLAARHGWQLEEARKLNLPELPAPVGRAWSVRDAVRTPSGGVAFEVRWLQWHWLIAHRRRLSVFVRILDVALPPFEVRPGGLARSDLELESGEFNRSFDVLGDNPRYLMATLHPRNLQTLLDARPISLAVNRAALVLSDDGPLTDSLTRGLTALDRLTIPPHVAEDYGQYRGTTPGRGLRFRLPDLPANVVLARLFFFAAGLLGLTYLSCLAAVQIYGA